MSKCTPECWTPVPCPICGDELDPRGRSLPLELSPSSCCDAVIYSKENRRHLWSEHDDARAYTDPNGWSEHVNNCEQCKETDS